MVAHYDRIYANLLIKQLHSVPAALGCNRHIAVHKIPLIKSIVVYDINECI